MIAAVAMTVSIESPAMVAVAPVTAPVRPRVV